MILFVRTQVQTTIHLLLVSMDSNEVNMSKIEYLKKVKTEKEIPLEIVEIIDSLEFETRLNDDETKFLFDEDDKCDIN